MPHENGTDSSITCVQMGATFTDNLNLQWYSFDGMYKEHYFRDIEYGITPEGVVYSSITGAKLPSDSARAEAIRTIINNHKASIDLSDQ